jgi:hypothetical protein
MLNRGLWPTKRLASLLRHYRDRPTKVHFLRAMRIYDDRFHIRTLFQL